MKFATVNEILFVIIQILYIRNISINEYNGSAFTIP